MRKIEEEMLKAIINKYQWSKDNTTVYASPRKCEVWLHGNHIADVFNDYSVKVNKYTLKRWPTVTTKSRLRALGVNVYTKNHQIYLNDERL